MYQKSVSNTNAGIFTTANDSSYKAFDYKPKQDETPKPEEEVEGQKPNVERKEMGSGKRQYEMPESFWDNN